MKIKKIIANNFKSFKNLEFEPKEVTYAIVGKNGAGKTTTQQIIRYALTGDLPDDPIKTGEDQLSVHTLLDSGADFCRSKSNSSGSKITLNGKTVTGKKLQEYLESKTNIPLEGIRLSSSADLVENMKPEAFGEFIMRYTPEALDVDIIKSHIGVVDPAVTEMLEEYFPKKGEKFGYGRVREIYDVIFKQRRDWKRELEERTARANSFKGEKPLQTMAEVNSELEKILKKQGEIDGIILANKAYKAALESREAQEKGIAELERQISLIKATRPLQSQLDDIKKSQQKVNGEIISLTAGLKTMESNLDLFNETLANLSSTLCPLSERLRCTTDKSTLKEEFEESVKATQEGIAEQNKLIAAKQAEIDALNKREREYNDNALAYNKLITLSSQLEKRKKELIIVPAKPAEIPSDASALEAKKHDLYVMRDRIAAWIQHEKDEDEATIFAVKVKVASILVDLLRPNGPVATKIAEYYIDVFEEICNQTLKLINPEYSLRLVAENGVQIEAKTRPGMDYVPYKNASSGEKACIIFAIMDLISRELTKLNIMVLDDLDKLDKNTFESLISFIMEPEIQDLYDHIIICAVDHEDTVATLKKYSNIELRMM